MKPIHAIKTLLACTALGLAMPLTAQDEQPDLEQLRAELEAARGELAQAARRMARLQRQLVEQEIGDDEIGRWISKDGDGIEIENIVIPDPSAFGSRVRFGLAPDTPRLGILVGRNDGEHEILGVTPGGGAEAAGLQRGDRVLAVNGIELGDGSPTISGAMEGVEAGSSVPVAVERNGERIEFEVATSAPEDDIHVFAHRFGELEEQRAHVESLREGLGDIEREIIVMRPGANAPGAPPRPRLPGLFVLGGNSDLVSNHEGLAPYFGTGDGVIVLRIDQDNPLKLEDGDVVLTIDGEPVRRPVDLGRAMIDRDPGEGVLLEIMRDGTLVQVEGSVPESLLPRPGAAPGLGLRTPLPPTGPLARRLAPPPAPPTAPIER